MISSRILLAGLFCLCPLSLAQKIEPDPKHTLIIISTSDIHGNLDKFPKLATLVKKYRSKFPHVLLMDSGDYFMGNPFVDDWEKPGLPITILMNKLGYDAATIGNHDMDYGQTALRDHIKGMPGTKIRRHQSFSFSGSGKLFPSLCHHSHQGDSHFRRRYRTGGHADYGYPENGRHYMETAD